MTPHPPIISSRIRVKLKPTQNGGRYAQVRHALLVGAVLLEHDGCRVGNTEHWTISDCLWTITLILLGHFYPYICLGGRGVSSKCPQSTFLLVISRNKDLFCLILTRSLREKGISNVVSKRSKRFHCKTLKETQCSQNVLCILVIQIVT